MNSGSRKLFSLRLARASMVATVAALLFSAPTMRAQQSSGAAASAAPAGNVENGKKVFKAHGCFACHGYSGDGSISPYQTQASSRAPRPSVTGARLAGMPLPLPAFMNYVRKPGGRMPAYGNSISESELADIYAYLKSQPPSPDPKSTPLLNGQ